MARTSSAFLLAVAGISGAEAWSVDGHAAVATIADALVSPGVSKVLLAELGQESLAKAAIWADDFDHHPEGRWSEPLHFIDYPGTACSFDWNRDCPDDLCNVGTITNYSKQIWDASTSKENRLMALNFVIHMMGDVHQPLHVSSGDDRGGNDIHVETKFAPSGPEEKHNLHQVWDSTIVVQMIHDLSAKALRGGPPPFHDFKMLADDLSRRLKGEWSSNSTAWQATVAGKQDETSLRKGLVVVASEAAALGCKWAYTGTDGKRIQSGDVLGAQYYASRKPIVEVQLAKGGARLAQLLMDSLVATRGELALIV